ncbi:FmdB family zinc ribbon protein [Methylococcus sp. EFPC2]|uniref:FmdB family zinc ribbon protein n=1 Tax=Methylococcus sp. EFPC2 TaxID=2812648 RepID=UPI001966F97A|nr:zinc ribbon domain-containing protein [Methylococcus sp. EFPC2]QSA98740.1 zinc ribbon domain-containing protein [Methylococcus sp. EFPC2]
MPTYDYQCQSCHRDFTAVHKIADPAPYCPSCGGEARKKLSAPAVQGGGRKPEPSFTGHGCGAGGCGCKH